MDFPEVNPWISVGRVGSFLPEKFPSRFFQTSQTTNGPQKYLSSVQNPGWLFYIEDYTTQLYRDYNKPL